MARRATLGLLCAALLAVPLVGVRETAAANDMSEANLGREQVEAVADKAAPNATILHHRSSMWYLVLVERRRQDLTLVDPFQHNPEAEYADIVWPADLSLEETDRRYGTDDFSGVTSARIAAKKAPSTSCPARSSPTPSATRPSASRWSKWRRTSYTGSFRRNKPQSAISLQLFARWRA
jgi:hypothetical protein